MKNPARPQGRLGDGQQRLGQLPHLAEVSLTAAMEPGNLRGPDVLGEPEVVDLGDAGLLVGTDRVRLLQIGRGLGSLGVAVRLDARWQPTASADSDGVAPLGLVRKCEEPPGRIRTAARSARLTPCPVIRKKPTDCSARSTCAATAARSSASPANQGDRSMAGNARHQLATQAAGAASVASPAVAWRDLGLRDRFRQGLQQSGVENGGEQEPDVERHVADGGTRPWRQVRYSTSGRRTARSTPRLRPTSRSARPSSV